MEKLKIFKLLQNFISQRRIGLKSAGAKFLLDRFSLNKIYYFQNKKNPERKTIMPANNNFASFAFFVPLREKFME